MELVLISLLSLFSFAATLEYKGCPPFSVEPCICSNSPHPYLTCDKVDEIDLLRDVFSISSNYNFIVVRISNSVLQYLPHEMFDKIGVLELELYNVTLVQLFDETPKNIKSLRTLHIENSYIFRGIIWEHLVPMENLKILNVYYNRIEAIDYEFVENAPKSLEQISFYDTKTSEIQAAAFTRFPNLDKVAIDHCDLSELKRNMFSKPFNGRHLYFNDNHLRILPADLFTDMPNIQTISLRGNSIATFPVTMFQVPFPKLEYLIIDGNPLVCDEDLKWILIKKIPVLKGTCFFPAHLRGKHLQELDVEDLELKY